MELFKQSIGLRKRKERPHGEISSKGKYEEMLEEAKKIANELASEKGVIGITLCGGLSRGYADELSEIDLNVYLEDHVYNEWIIGMGPVPHADALWKGNYLDIDFLSFEKEKKEDWGLIKKWDISYNVILFDPDGKIEELFHEKDIFSSEEKLQSVSEYFGKCMYIGDLVIQQWIKRGDPLAANQLINSAISGLIGLLFLANEEFPPHEKWALNYSYSLKWLPKYWKKRISEIILTKEISIKETKRRHNLFVDLYKDCWEKIVGKESRDLEFIDIMSQKELQFIINNSPISVDKFAERFDIKHLSYEPIYKFINITLQNGNKIILFNKEEFIKERKANYPDVLDWSKSFLKKLKLDYK
ncbi:MAG: nucleotidyltransferase domain-containing protein [Promethearchaeota archaeon]|nr:MAG: nucleotidyltransferase domain-containing protein [Candidatus Lokiarchaeota archaeon]